MEQENAEKVAVRDHECIILKKDNIGRDDEGQNRYILN